MVQREANHTVNLLAMANVTGKGERALGMAYA
jgi:hypothetical protein